MDGGFAFVRWTTRGIGPDEQFEGIGTDRFRLRGGLAAEGLIKSDLPVFEHLARRGAHPTGGASLSVRIAELAAAELDR